MTASGYIELAATLAANLESAYLSGNSAAVHTAADIPFTLADIFEMRDPRFDRTRFLRASGVGV